jgi:hypothetical protein
MISALLVTRPLFSQSVLITMVFTGYWLLVTVYWLTGQVFFRFSFSRHNARESTSEEDSRERTDFCEAGEGVQVYTNGGSCLHAWSHREGDGPAY